MEPEFKTGITCSICGAEGVMMEHDGTAQVIWCSDGHVMVREDVDKEPRLVHTFGQGVLKVTIGPGKYDDLCTIVMEKSQAGGVLVIIFGGNKGHGFSMQVTNLEMIKKVPEVLEDVAKQIRGDKDKWPGNLPVSDVEGQ